jgi:riboflavin synthase
VNGVCLTVVAQDDSEVHADIGPETLRVTTLGSLGRGTLVNLERSMRADSRFGGHFVQGHVDAVGRIEAVRPDAEFHTLSVSYPPRFASNLILRGSIAVDGISLTVAGLTTDRFELMIIPFTMVHTNLRLAAAGSPVNLEFDMVGKYVARAAELATLASLSSTEAGRTAGQ